MYYSLILVLTVHLLNSKANAQINTSIKQVIVVMKFINLNNYFYFTKKNYYTFIEQSILLLIKAVSARIKSSTKKLPKRRIWICLLVKIWRSRYVCFLEMY